VGELLARMSSRELAEWQAYAQLDPFGNERGDLQAGIVASMIANVYRDRKKQRKPFAPADFLPVFERKRKRRQTWQQQLQIVEMLNQAFGGRDLRKDRD